MNLQRDQMGALLKFMAEQRPYWEPVREAFDHRYISFMVAMSYGEAVTPLPALPAKELDRAVIVYIGADPPTGSQPPRLFPGALLPQIIKASCGALVQVCKPEAGFYGIR